MGWRFHSVHLHDNSYYNLQTLDILQQYRNLNNWGKNLYEVWSINNHLYCLMLIDIDKIDKIFIKARYNRIINTFLFV